jgi:hypothetical protein
MLMPDTAAPCSPANAPRRALLSRIAGALLTSLSCAACSTNTATVPMLPTPAADLMRPAPTGSAYLESVSRELKALDDDLERWEKTLQDGLTR